MASSLPSPLYPPLTHKGVAQTGGAGVRSAGGGGGQGKTKKANVYTRHPANFCTPIYTPCTILLLRSSNHTVRLQVLGLISTILALHVLNLCSCHAFICSWCARIPFYSYLRFPPLSLDLYHRRPGLPCLPRMPRPSFPKPARANGFLGALVHDIGARVSKFDDGKGTW